MDKNPTVNPAVVLRKEFDDWAVLFNPDTAEAVGINPLGVFIWELLAKDRQPSQIISSIREQYDKVPDTIEEEVASFITSLTRRGYLGYQVGEIR